MKGLKAGLRVTLDADRSILGLSRRWLKCPIVENDGQGGGRITRPKQGTPPGWGDLAALGQYLSP